MNAEKFFQPLRPLNQKQVDAYNAILSEAQRRKWPIQWAAYAMATVRHETGGTLEPVVENLNYTTPERIMQVWPGRFPDVASARPYLRSPAKLANKVYGGREDLGNRPGTDDGWNYRGRGLAQITGYGNYTKFGIQGQPDDALKLPVSVRILMDGLEKGLFTGKALKDYDTYKAMRAVVNGDGRLNGATIAAWAEKYEAALRAAGYGSKTTQVVGGAGAAVGVALGVTLPTLWPWLIAGAIVVGVIYLWSRRK